MFIRRRALGGSFWFGTARSLPCVRGRFSEPLEPRVLLSVSFLPNPYTTPTHHSEIALGTISNFVPIEPMIRVNPTDPVNVVASSQRGARISNDGGGFFLSPFNFTIPPGFATQNGDTDMAFDAAGRLYWANMAGNGTSGV